MSTHEPGPARPVFFIHVMKTGGTTLFRNLRDHFAVDEVYPYRKLDVRYDGPALDIRHHLSVAYLRGLPEERRRRIRVYTGHFPYVTCALLGADFETVTILRDPVERTISLLRGFLRNPPWVDPSRPRPWAARRLEDVYEDPRVYGPLVHDHQTKVFSMTEADEPDSYMDEIRVDEARLALAKDNLSRIDVVGLTERYGDFVDALNARFGWNVEEGEPANVTPAEVMAPVSESFRRRIAQDNAIDVELYAHAARLVERRRQRPAL